MNSKMCKRKQKWALLGSSTQHNSSSARRLAEKKAKHWRKKSLLFPPSKLVNIQPASCSVRLFSLKRVPVHRCMLSERSVEEKILYSIKLETFIESEIKSLSREKARQYQEWKNWFRVAAVSDFAQKLNIKFGVCLSWAGAEAVFSRHKKSC